MIETGILFGNIHSFFDLNLILAPFTPAPAMAKTVYVDVAGADEPVDLTEAHGKVFYNPRDFSFTFTINPADKMTFDAKVTQVSNALNGKRCKITLDRDPEYYWQGRCVVNEYKQDRRIGQIVVGAKVNPYKLKQEPTVHSFTLTAEEQTVTLWNGRKSAVPVFECTDDNTVVVFGDIRETMSAGTHKFLDICFNEGVNVLKLSGTGTIKITYQEGEL